MIWWFCFGDHLISMSVSNKPVQHFPFLIFSYHLLNFHPKCTILSDVRSRNVLKFEWVWVWGEPEPSCVEKSVRTSRALGCAERERTALALLLHLPPSQPQPQPPKPFQPSNPHISPHPVETALWNKNFQFVQVIIVITTHRTIMIFPKHHLTVYTKMLIVNIVIKTIANWHSMLSGKKVRKKVALTLGQGTLKRFSIYCRIV